MPINCGRFNQLDVRHSPLRVLKSDLGKELRSHNLVCELRVRTDEQPTSRLAAASHFGIG